MDRKRPIRKTWRAPRSRSLPARRRTEGRFHQICRPRWINVILYEPMPGEFVWMSFYLRPDLRNRRLCKEITRYVLNLLPGRHHIHFFPEITTLCRLAQEDSWLLSGRSGFFSGCVAYQTESLVVEPALAPLLRGLLEHNITRRRPYLPTFLNSKTATRAIRRIDRHFQNAAVIR